MNVVKRFCLNLCSVSLFLFLGESYFCIWTLSIHRTARLFITSLSDAGTSHMSAVTQTGNNRLSLFFFIWKSLLESLAIKRSLPRHRPSHQHTRVPVLNNHTTLRFSFFLHHPPPPLVWLLPLHLNTDALWLWPARLFPDSLFIRTSV